MATVFEVCIEHGDVRVELPSDSPSVMFGARSRHDDVVIAKKRRRSARTDYEFALTGGLVVDRARRKRR